MLRILAYCDAQYLAATWRVVGEMAEVLSSPPLTQAEILPEMLEGYDVIYLDLHGQEGSGFLYNYSRKYPEPALSVRTVQMARFEDTVVVATTCYLPETPFVKAFLRSGARAVIGGPGPNYGTQRRLSGAQVLAKRVINTLRRGEDPEEALKRAKWWLFYSGRIFWDRMSTKDALGFEVFANKEREDAEAGSGNE